MGNLLEKSWVTTYRGYLSRTTDIIATGATLTSAASIAKTGIGCWPDRDRPIPKTRWGNNSLCILDRLDLGYNLCMARPDTPVHLWESVLTPQVGIQCVIKDKFQNLSKWQLATCAALSTFLKNELIYVTCCNSLHSCYGHLESAVYAGLKSEVS